MQSYRVNYRPYLRLTAEQVAEEGRKVIAGWRPDVAGVERDGAVVTFNAPRLVPGLRASIEATGGFLQEVAPPRRPIPQPFKVPSGASRKRPKGARYIITTEHYPESAGSPDGIYVVELFWPTSRETDARAYVARRRLMGLDASAVLHLGSGQARREEAAMGRALRGAARRGVL